MQLMSRVQGNKQVDIMLDQLEKRRKRINKMMATAPFQRTMDKIAYVLGTTIIILYSYLIGKYPHSLIYTYTSLLMVCLLAHRYYTYWSNGYHMYLVDFCYVANAAMLFLINFDSRNQGLLVTCFVFSNGPLAAAIAAFRNSLVYHRIDMLCSLAIHAIPMTLTMHMRWYTVPEQSHLPVEEQRFAPFIENETWGDSFRTFFVEPTKIYFIWLAGYALANFVFTSKVSDYTYDSTYRTFTTNPALTAKVKGVPLPMQVIFLACHFLYYLVLLLIGVIMWQSYWINIAAVIFWLGMSAWAGANYYMDYFSKKYETQLMKLS